jgi:DNA-binding transcriptional MerR regulator
MASPDATNAILLADSSAARASADRGPSQGAPLHQIGEAAERVGLSLRTVRYYEEVGLVVPSGRTQGGFRLYTENDIERLALIKRMKPLGFPLDDMRDLLQIRDRLAARELQASERARFLERLAAYTQTAAEQCARLRAQLAMAEEFAETLQRQVQKYQAAPEDSR